jgi:hypothetical protein
MKMAFLVVGLGSTASSGAIVVGFDTQRSSAWAQWNRRGVSSGGKVSEGLSECIGACCPAQGDRNALAWASEWVRDGLVIIASSNLCHRN